MPPSPSKMDNYIPIIDFDPSTTLLASNFDDPHRGRLNDFIKSFQDATRLASPPEYIIKTPGRINLIGDHIDYHGFSVLPMAIDNSILVGLSTTTTTAAAAAAARSPHAIINADDFEDHHNAKEENPCPNRPHAGQNGFKDEKPLLTILNSNPTSYPPFQCEHSFSNGSKLDQSHRWHHYILCGCHGVLARELLSIESSQIHKHSKAIVASGDYVKLDAEQLTSLPNVVLFVGSNLPPASGLSSSSALVCASALATRLLLLTQANNNNNHHNHNHNNRHNANNTNQSLVSGDGDDVGREMSSFRISSASLAEDCAKFEHLVGTSGGGMDQAVILTAQEGYAKHIEFMPAFKCDNVRLPEGVAWLVSHCGHECVKAATLGFNSRVLETKLAAALILKTLLGRRASNHHQVTIDHSITLGRVMKAIFEEDEEAGDGRQQQRPADAAGATRDSQQGVRHIMETLSKSVFHDASTQEMSIEGVCSRLGMSRHELIGKFMTSEEFLVRSQLEERVCLYKRCRHVLEEAERVRQFRHICETSRDARRLGELMSESHSSLRDNYECSHPSLDKLVEISLQAGALGARLTGAGWGGCVVSLVEASKVDLVMGALEKVSKFTFRTEPKCGATIIRVLQSGQSANHQTS